MVSANARPRFAPPLPVRAARRTWRAGGLLIAAILTGCSPVSLINALVPRDGYRGDRGLAYGPAERNGLGVYRPLGADGPLPVVVFFYGGNWQSGDKEMYLFVGE